MELWNSIYNNSLRTAFQMGAGSTSDPWSLSIIKAIDEILRNGKSDSSTRALARVLNSERSLNPYVCLRQLFEKEEWSDLGHVRELARASRATLLIGEYSLDLSILIRLVQRLPTVAALLRQYLPSGTNASVLWRSYSWHRALGFLRVVAACKTQGTASLSALIYWTRYQTRAVKSHRFHILRGMRDRSYHLADHLNMDVENCCISYFQRAIRHEQNLDILSMVSHAAEEDSTCDLPSWTSLFKRSEQDACPLPLLFDRGDVAEVEEEDGDHARPFMASKQIANPSFMDWRKMYIDAWRVTTLESRCPNTASLEPFRAAGYGRFIENRPLYHTSDGRACLAPSDSEDADDVFILAGGRTPYILRRQREEYRFTGEW